MVLLDTALLMAVVRKGMGFKRLIGVMPANNAPRIGAKMLPFVARRLHGRIIVVEPKEETLWIVVRPRCVASHRMVRVVKAVSGQAAIPMALQWIVVGSEANSRRFVVELGLEHDAWLATPGHMRLLQVPQTPFGILVGKGRMIDHCGAMGTREGLGEFVEACRRPGLEEWLYGPLPEGDRGLVPDLVTGRTGEEGGPTREKDGSVRAR
jgi:hypothetical protein